MNITNTIESIIALFINIISSIWNTLYNIKIWDTNLLQWTITILVLSVVIPILFTIVSSGSSYGSRVVINTIEGREAKINREARINRTKKSGKRGKRG